MRSSKEVFTEIYEDQKWGESIDKGFVGNSGPGSEDSFNKEIYVPVTKAFIENNNIKSIADIGCGDFVSGPQIYENLKVKYKGYDVYENLVNHLNKKYKDNKKYDFVNLDATTEMKKIKKADLCILKDVLQHWPNNTIYTFLDYVVKEKLFKYILICNCYDWLGYDGTHTHYNNNQGRQKWIKTGDDVWLGGWRPLSYDKLPLSKYNMRKLYTYRSKQVNLLDLSNS